MIDNALVEVAAICRLKARYFRYLDTKDWDGLRSVFTEDFVFIDDGKNLTHRSREAFMAMVIERHANSVSVHQGLLPEIDIIDASNAVGTWAMSDEVVIPNAVGETRQSGAGHYHDTYRKLGDDWLISSSRLTRLRLSVTEVRRAP